MTDKALGMLGLMKRAGAISVGEYNTGSVTHEGKTVLIVVAADASDNAKKRALGFSYSGRVQSVVLPYTKDELASALGIASCSMAAMTNSGFAAAFVKLLNENGDFSELAAALSELAGADRQKPAKGKKKNKHIK